MCIFSFPAFFATCAHNKITLQVFGTFSCSFKQEGEAAAAETRQTQKLKKERRKESQQHTKAATQPHPVWTVSRPDPKVQHLSTERCRTALQLFTPVMPTISLYSFLRDRPQTYSLKKRAQQVPTKRLTKGLCDNAAMPAEIADWIAHHSRSHVLGARAIRDFSKMWAVMAPQNWVPTVEDAGCEGFFKAEGSAGKKEQVRKPTNWVGEREKVRVALRAVKWNSENVDVRDKAKAHHVPKDTTGGLDQHTALSQRARRKGGVREVGNFLPIISSFGTRLLRAFQRCEKKTVCEELAPWWSKTGGNSAHSNVVLPPGHNLRLER